MCGLAGRFHHDQLPPAPGWRSRAGLLLAHRGPDGAGWSSDEHCELVHRRLALLDLSPAGIQPLANETGDIQVVCNGEIYNHRDLRALLAARGHTFHSRTDTEVLVHLYEERGERLVDFLRGIFAFAIYDVRRRRVLLARDRFGVKPLFYAFCDGQLVFASEIKAIVALPGFQPALDRQACVDFLGLGYVPEPATGFANVHALPPGMILTTGADGHRLQAYHTVQARPDLARRLPESAALAGERLMTAVGRQVDADVPVAALLTGGIDSSLVVAAYGRANATGGATFNVRFPAPSPDDTCLALAVSRRFRTEHHTLEHRSWTLSTDALCGLLRHFDQPFADTSCIPTFWVSQAIRDRGIICALSGDGGHEAFGGYERFWRANQLIRLMRLPAWARGAVRHAGAALTPWTRNLGRRLANAATLAEAGLRDSSVVLAGLANYLGEDQKQALLLPTAREPLLPVDRHFDGFLPAATGNLEELSRRITEKLFAVALPSDMLRKVDMMSMLAGIAVRVPLLDEDVVAVGLSLPHRLKTDGREGKVVLRSVARDWLPREVATHPQRGFHLPLEVLATPATAMRCEELLLGSDAQTGWFLNRALMGEWLGRFRSVAARRSPEGRSNGLISGSGLAQRVMTLLSLELWMRDYGLAW